MLWNGIEIDSIAKVDPEPAPRPAVLFIGRHEPRKGLAVLLDAWDGIDRDADLWVVGTGPQTEELQARRPKQVEWFGTVSDERRNALLRGASVFCAPALGGESFGVVLLEAMAARTPVVASAIEGYANVATADLDALLVPPGDARSLRAAVQRMLDDPPLAERLVAAGDDTAAKYSMRGLAQRYLELYERALVAA